jgi:hypothetical protein
MLRNIAWMCEEMAIMEDVSFLLWHVFFIIVVIGITFLFIQSRSGEKNKFLLGATIFLILYGICRVFFFLDDFSPLGSIYWLLGAEFGIISLTFLIFIIERFVFQKSKYAFTISGSIGIILYSIFMVQQSIETIALLQMIFLPLIAVIIPLIYLYIALKSAGEPRKKALIIFFGIILLMMGNIFHFTEFKTSLELFYYILTPISFIGGTSLLLYGFT